MATILSQVYTKNQEQKDHFLKFSFSLKEHYGKYGAEETLLDESKYFIIGKMLWKLMKNQ